MVSSRRSHCRATSTMARVAWSRRSAFIRKRTSRPCFRRPISPACSSTTRCLETAWRVKGTWPARQLALASPRWTRRSSTRRREGSAIAAHRSSSGSVLISFHPYVRSASNRARRSRNSPQPPLCSSAYRCLSTSGQLSGSRPLSTTRRRVCAPSPTRVNSTRREFPAAGSSAGGVVPSERETGRRIHRFDHDRAALFTEAHVATGAGLDLQLHLVGEPLADLVGLRDGAPHYLDRGVGDDLPL